MPRTRHPRFSINDRVIASDMRHRFTGRVGIVLAVQESRRAHTLDKYTVEFENKDQETFWDIEIELTA